jgi:hypothetical protein
MDSWRRFALPVAAGAALGAVILGGGGRAVMRVLALSIGNPAVFSLGGSLEVVLYGAIVGLAGGFVAALAAPALRRHPLAGGVLLGLLVYAGAVATLPAHIAATARPFAAHMPLVWSLFGLCFLLWGLAVGRFARRG